MLLILLGLWLARVVADPLRQTVTAASEVAAGNFDVRLNERRRDEFGERGRGMWRFVDDARRYVPGSWPSGPPHAFVRRHAVTAVAN